MEVNCLSRRVDAVSPPGLIPHPAGEGITAVAHGKTREFQPPAVDSRSLLLVDDCQVSCLTVLDESKTPKLETLDEVSGGIWFHEADAADFRIGTKRIIGDNSFKCFPSPSKRSYDCVPPHDDGYSFNQYGQFNLLCGC